MPQYNGHCPLCQAVLEPRSETLVCPNKDYVADKDAYEKIWDDNEKAISELYDRLLYDLEGLNAKPTVI